MKMKNIAIDNHNLELENQKLKEYIKCICYNLVFLKWFIGKDNWKMVQQIIDHIENFKKENRIDY